MLFSFSFYTRNYVPAMCCSTRSMQRWPPFLLLNNSKMLPIVADHDELIFIFLFCWLSHESFIGLRWNSRIWNLRKQYSVLWHPSIVQVSPCLHTDKHRRCAHIGTHDPTNIPFLFSHIFEYNFVSIRHFIYWHKSISDIFQLLLLNAPPFKTIKLYTDLLSPQRFTFSFFRVLLSAFSLLAASDKTLWLLLPSGQNMGGQ